MIRIYLNSERTSLGASGVFVSPELWDSKSNKIKGRTSEALQANLQLENIRAHLSAMYKKMEFDESLSVELIKSKYLGKQIALLTSLMRILPIKTNLWVFPYPLQRSKNMTFARDTSKSL